MPHFFSPQAFFVLGGVCFAAGDFFFRPSAPQAILFVCASNFFRGFLCVDFALNTFVWVWFPLSAYSTSFENSIETVAVFLCLIRQLEKGEGVASDIRNWRVT